MNKFLCLLTIASLLAMQSCNEKPAPEPGKPTGPTKVTFTATTEAVGNTSLVWSAYDEIDVYSEGATAPVTMGVKSGSGKSSATFSGTIDSSDSYFAFYPAGAAECLGDGIFSFELPRNRAAGESLFECGQIYRASEGTASEGFAFNNLMGFVELRIAGSGTVSSIKLNSTSTTAMSGQFRYDTSSQSLTSTGGENSAVARLPRTMVLSTTPKSIFVMLPEGRYSGMTVTLSGDHGQQFIVNSDVVVTRSAVTTVSDLTLNGDYVDLTFMGDWHLVQFCGTAAEVDIYLSLRDDDSFTLYQRAFDYPLSVYEGVYSYDIPSSTISGRYSDDVEWDSSYTIAMSGDDKMIWTNTTTAEVSVYERCELPVLPETSATRTTTDVKRFL